MAIAPYRRGLHELCRGVFAYLQPDGGYGWNNAGLIHDRGGSLLIDTLFDEPLTRGMLTIVAATAPGPITTVVNTHAHPDHTAGNGLFPGADIVASESTAAEMARMAAGDDPIGTILAGWQAHGEAGAYLHDVMGEDRFAPRGPQVMPTTTFDRELQLTAGGQPVDLLRVGPAHTSGDVVAHLPAAGVLFTGDVVFHQVHPLVTGPPAPWIDACRRLLEFDPSIVVPGHGPVGGRSAIQTMIDYLEYVQEQASRCFDAGRPFETAAAGIPLGRFAGWADEERIVINVAGVYAGHGEPAPLLDVLAAAGRYRRRHRPA